MTIGSGAELLVIITSDEPHGNIGNSHQHYFDVISKKYATVFVQPPEAWNPLRWFTSRRLKTHAGRSVIFQYVNYFPVSVFRVFFTKVNDLINCWFLNRRISPRKKIVLWKFDSFRMMKIPFLPAHKTIYHVVDPVFRKDTDPHVARTADLIVVVNKAYFEHYGRYNKKMIYIPHGIRSEDLVTDASRTARLIQQYGKYLLVTGSVNNDVNLPLLQRIAGEFTSHTLLIIGNSFLRDPEKIRQFEQLVSRPNVRFSGVVHYLELKHYIAGAEACLVPYQSLREGFFRNPIKITNYISQFRPVINSVSIPELSVLEGRIVFTSTAEEGFVELIRKVLEGGCRVDTDFVKGYLAENNYEVLVEKILAEM